MTSAVRIGKSVESLLHALRDVCGILGMFIDQEPISKIGG